MLKKVYITFVCTILYARHHFIFIYSQIVATGSMSILIFPQNFLLFFFSSCSCAFSLVSHPKSLIPFLSSLSDVFSSLFPSFFFLLWEYDDYNISLQKRSMLPFSFSRWVFFSLYNLMCKEAQHKRMLYYY